MKKLSIFKPKEPKDSKLRLLIAILIIVLMLFLVASINNRYFDFFKPRCEVTNVVDYQQCLIENHYITIHSDTIYLTNYVYEQGNKKALFVDIPLKNKSLIALIDEEKVNELLQTEGPITIEGHIELDTNKNFEEARKKIITDAQQESTDEIDQKEIAHLFQEGVVNQAYEGRGHELAFIATFLILIMLLSYEIGKSFYQWYKKKEPKKKKKKKKKKR